MAVQARTFSHETPHSPTLPQGWTRNQTATRFIRWPPQPRRGLPQQPHGTQLFPTASCGEAAGVVTAALGGERGPPKACATHLTWFVVSWLRLLSGSQSFTVQRVSVTTINHRTDSSASQYCVHHQINHRGKALIWWATFTVVQVCGMDPAKTLRLTRVQGASPHNGWVVSFYWRCLKLGGARQTRQLPSP